MYDNAEEEVSYYCTLSQALFREAIKESEIIILDGKDKYKIEAIYFFSDGRIELKKGKPMDKKIKKIQKETKKVSEDLGSLKKADKKRDPMCEAGEKMMKKKGK